MGFNYAVVHWYNYRKELHSGFIKGFDNFEEAKKHAYDLAKQDNKVYGTDKVISEDEITDNNGPGKSGSPYTTIVGYGGRYETGYATTFYCVVEWFEGVTNNWEDGDKSDDNDNEWYPCYYY